MGPEEIMVKGSVVSTTPAYKKNPQLDSIYNMAKITFKNRVTFDKDIGPVKIATGFVYNSEELSIYGYNKVQEYGEFPLKRLRMKFRKGSDPNAPMTMISDTPDSNPLKIPGVAVNGSPAMINATHAIGIVVAINLNAYLIPFDKNMDFLMKKPKNSICGRGK